jgi:signal transduction histidine kinase
MHVALISRDDSLKRLCREVLATLPVRHRNLLVASPDEPAPAADLYVWDWEPQMSLPHLLGRQGSSLAHMLAIDRQEAHNIADAMDETTCAAVTLVLKPVNPAALRTFLEQGANHCDSPGVETGRIGSLRRDRDTILDSLLATNLRLQEYDRDRMNFLARAVHDFRTPLTAVNGYCGLLLSGEFGPLTRAQHEVLDRTLHSVRRLSRLATALFQWSSGLHVGFEFQIREADIVECCRQALHEVRPLTDEKSIAVDLDLQAPGQPLCFDPALAEQLLINLLENSCKFTPRGGCIRVQGFPAFWERRAAAVSQNGVLIERRRVALQRANAYRVEVSDNGMGVRPEHLQTIFQEYTSYGGGGDRSGSGLGLAICKRILAEHGGEIFAESRHKGVTFVFHLPFSRPAAGESSAVDRGIHLVA